MRIRTLLMTCISLMLGQIAYTQTNVLCDTVQEIGLGLSIPAAAASFTGSMNTHIGAQETIITHKGFQYIGYYNENRHIVLGRRDLCGGAWEYLTFEDYTQREDDRHNYLSLGICPNDGTLHLAFDHHTDTLHYRVSNYGLVNKPESFSWGTNHFSPVRNYLIEGQIHNKLTYPAFVTIPNGDLNFMFRDKISAKGTNHIAYYRGRTHLWETVHQFSSLDGVYTDPYFDLPSSSRSAYPFDYVYDDNGILHYSWVWRENPEGNPYNHDIGYAWSPDYGYTWYNNDGEQIAGINSTDTTLIRYDSPGINVWLIDSRYGMINNGGQTIDHLGQPHLLVRHRSEPADSNAMPTYVVGGNKFHYWRDTSGIWHQQEVPFGGSRSRIYSDQEGNLFVPFAHKAEPSNFFSPIVLNLGVAYADENWSEWEIIYQGNINSFKNEPPMDRLFLQDHGGFTLVNHNATGVDWAGMMYTTDLKLDKNYSSTIQIDPTDDTYVRADTFSHQNFGSDNSLVVKDIDNDAFDRKIYLKFDLSKLSDLEVAGIQSAQLVLGLRVGENGYTSEEYSLFKIEEDSWNEDNLTWDNAPQNGNLIQTIQGATERMMWDVTQAVIQEYQGDRQLSLSIQQTNENGNPIIHFFSKEVDVTGMSPRLIIKADSSCYQRINCTVLVDTEKASIHKPMPIIYPNPANRSGVSLSNLDQFIGEEIAVIISDMTGREVLSQEFDQLQNKTVQLNLKPSSPSGLYNVLIRTKDRHQTLLFVLQND